MKAIMMLPLLCALLLTATSNMAQTVESSLQFTVTAVKDSEPNLILPEMGVRHSNNHEDVVQMIRKNIFKASQLSGTKIILVTDKEQEYSSISPYIRVIWPSAK
ncbi:MAG: hypothetical protein ACRC5A_15905 [Enterobacteriaceae bacterium]